MKRQSILHDENWVTVNEKQQPEIQIEQKTKCTTNFYDPDFKRDLDNFYKECARKKRNRIENENHSRRWYPDDWLQHYKFMI